MRAPMSVLTLLLSASLLGACARSAAPEAMTTGQVVRLDTVPELRRSMQVWEVVGGHETPPVGRPQVAGPDFRVALEDSLRLNGLLADRVDDARYAVSAAIVAVDKPPVGIDAEVTTTVNYRVVDRATGQEVFQRVVTRDAMSPEGTQFAGWGERRLAAEAAMRENIGEFIREFTVHMADRHRRDRVSLQLDDVLAPRLADWL